jgi:hypothetical protein
MIVQRPGLEHRIAASVDAERIPVISGGCGSGRTSLLLRLVQLIGQERCQYIDLAACASTPERCLAAIISACPFRLRSGQLPSIPASPRAAFDALLTFLDEAATPDGEQITFLVDEVLDLRTFESFPGLRHVQRDFVARLASSRNRFVLASGFTTRTHRLLRDAPARFEVIHIPPLEPAEVASFAMLFDGARPDWSRSIAPAVTSLVGGRAAYAQVLLSTMTQFGAATDPVAALASQLAPDGRLTALCRECYEFRLHRARGYGALKAILGVLAEVEPLNLTEISQRLRRTPGSTKDYLSWLEDVDLVAVQRKRYSFDDPLLRLYLRLHGRPVPPTDDDLVREVHAYAQSRLPRATEQPIPASAAVHQQVQQPGIIEID